MLSIFIARRYKGLERAALAKRLEELLQSSVSEGTQDQLHASTRAALSFVVPLAYPEKQTVEVLEKAVETMSKEDPSVIVQALLALPGGKVLKKEAIAVLEKRKANTTLTEKINDICARTHVVLATNQHHPHDAVRIFAQHMSAAISFQAPSLLPTFLHQQGHGFRDVVHKLERQPQDFH